MSNILKYRGYIGSVEHSIEDEILYGKIECINDIVTYEAENIKGLKVEFESAVDDYLATCKDLEKQPDKPMNGSFNVRVGQDNHKKAFIAAKEQEISLNEFVKIAIEEKLIEKKEFHIHIESKTIATSGTFGPSKKSWTAMPDEVRH
ncbi:type II toxin-antitoxin system HicB family antitoxin [Xenorhabdus bovienii]|uniref:type II toxin-antitoxin system HicB family antitoxin n=1 Tax=Xenorhabdus bovienii TaxID=40576 RepID=UPI0023B30B9B|nr:type II toxin-antitoxin system HicB family antitoxin [Xenorhabdus bovienii]MDE9552872.1 type II toxin-antitoxin system HicB family antitoxin [Xenorhabdus bovienii]